MYSLVLAALMTTGDAAPGWWGYYAPYPYPYACYGYYGCCGPVYVQPKSFYQPLPLRPPKPPEPPEPPEPPKKFEKPEEIIPPVPRKFEKPEDGVPPVPKKFEKPDEDKKMEKPDGEKKPDKPEGDKKPDKPEGDKKPDKPEGDKKEEDKKEGDKKEEDKVGSSVPAPGLLNRARVVVQLAPNARVYVNGQLLGQTEGTRTFLTPALRPGTDYYYTIRANRVRDGQTVSETRRVIVRANEEVRVSQQDLDPASRATITVRLPADAALFVNDEPCSLTSATRQFRTPVLAPGRQYSYSLKCQVVRDGETRTESRQVVFRSGEQVTVEFGSTAAASRSDTQPVLEGEVLNPGWRVSSAVPGWVVPVADERQARK